MPVKSKFRQKIFIKHLVPGCTILTVEFPNAIFGGLGNYLLQEVGHNLGASSGPTNPSYPPTLGPWVLFGNVTAGSLIDI